MRRKWTVTHGSEWHRPGSPEADRSALLFHFADVAPLRETVSGRSMHGRDGGRSCAPTAVVVSAGRRALPGLAMGGGYFEAVWAR